MVTDGSARHAIHIPGEIVAVELDLDGGDAAVGNPGFQRLGQAVADRLLYFGRGERIGRAHRMIHADSRRGLAAGCTASRYSPRNSASGSATDRSGQNRCRRRAKAVAAVQPAECVVKGRVDGAGGHQRAELRNGRGSFISRDDFGGGLQIFGLERVFDVERMGISVIAPRDLRDLLRQRLSSRPAKCRTERRGRTRCFPCDMDAKPSPICRPSCHAAVDVQHGDAVHFLAAEFVGRAVEEIGEVDVEVFDAGVGGSRRRKKCGHGQKFAPRRCS